VDFLNELFLKHVVYTCSMAQILRNMGLPYTLYIYFNRGMFLRIVVLTDCGL